MKLTKNQSGQLLVEALIAITIIVAVVTIGSQVIVASLKGNKFSNEKNVALGLAEETIEAVEAAALEKWQNIYKPPDGAGDASADKGSINRYYAAQSSGKWAIASGDNQITINGLTYTAYFTIDNVSRDLTTKDVESVYNASRDDPSTQKITVTISWTGGEPIVLSQYISRWRNQVCAQTDWSGSQNTTGTSTCPTTSYGLYEGNLDRSGGTLKLDPL